MSKASLSAFARLEDIPVDYWIATVFYGTPRESGHRTLTVVQRRLLMADNWSPPQVMKSRNGLPIHGVKRLIAGPSVKPDQGRVEYLVEICDPCQSRSAPIRSMANCIGPSILQFFSTQFRLGPCVIAFPERLAHRAGLTRGYLSWCDEHRRWWQSQWYEGTEPSFVDCGTILPEFNFRAQIDSLTKNANQRVENVW